MLPLANAKTNEVCTLAASLAFRSIMDMEDILSACSWAFHSTFMEFYLRDTAFLTEGSSTLNLLLLLNISSVLVYMMVLVFSFTYDNGCYLVSLS